VIDTVPPSITIDSAPDRPPFVDVNDENPDPSALQVYLNEERYDPSQPLAAGTYTLRATTRDLAGNIAEISQEITMGPPCQEQTYVHFVNPTTTLSAMHYFPWYSGSPECTNIPQPNTPWCKCIWGPKPQNPRTWKGFYDSSTQSVINGHIDQMISKGVDVISIEWTGNSTQRGIIENQIIPYIVSRNKKFVILYDTSIRFGGLINFNDPFKRDQFITDFNTFASSGKYFKNSNYLKFGNDKMPVVYIYVTRAILGSDANISWTFQQIKNAAIQNGFNGLFIVADHLYWGIVDYHKLSLIIAGGEGAVTSFGPVDPSQGIPEDPGCANVNGRAVRQWANKMSTLYSNAVNSLQNLGFATDLDPGIFVQYDDTGLNTPFCWSRSTVHHWRLCDGSDWNHMIVNAGLNRDKVAQIVDVLPNCSIQRYSASNYTSIIWTYSYNEWGEGAGCEQLNGQPPPAPAYPYRFELLVLDILKGLLP